MLNFRFVRTIKLVLCLLAFSAYAIEAQEEQHDSSQESTTENTDNAAKAKEKPKKKLPRISLPRIRIPGPGENPQDVNIENIGLTGKQASEAKALASLNYIVKGILVEVLSKYDIDILERYMHPHAFEKKKQKLIKLLADSYHLGAVKECKELISKKITEKEPNMKLVTGNCIFENGNETVYIIVYRLENEYTVLDLLVN